jgi:hypothetical protein
MQRNINMYYEVRSMPLFGPPTPAASDIARHLQSRQYLGITVVVCHNPLSMLSATRKQWLRLARNLQKQRASTLNAEEILRFTHTITHMQHLQFVAQKPTDQAEAHIFFVQADELGALPPGCQTLYITTAPHASRLQTWIDTLGADALVVDYKATLNLQDFGLEPKSNLEDRMLKQWAGLRDFMTRQGTHIDQLVIGNIIQSARMDEALDALLGVSNEFLRRAAEFQHILSLAQPLKTSTPNQSKQFETVMRLAHRVQSLTPGSFGNYLVKTFGDHHAESFFLRDATPEEDSSINPIPKEEVTYENMEGVPLIIEFV